MFKIKKNYRRKRRRENSPVDFTFFGYADVIKYQEKLTISRERTQITTDYYRLLRARGHKTIGNHLNAV